ncbi:MAG: tetratricopeptide repeat protein [Bacteroidales bacterium]|nr:tetratricopeptide repeat protein [Bacteroidales bacterium]
MQTNITNFVLKKNDGILLIIWLFLLIPQFFYAQSADGYYRMGLFKYNIRDFDAALSNFSKAVEISPNYEKAYEKLGLLKYRLEDYNGAINDFTIAVGYFPDDANSFYFRGMAKIQIKNYTGAIEDFNKVLEIYPNNELALSKLGYVNYLIEMYAESIEFYDKALIIREDLGEAYFYRGMAKHKINDKLGGCADLERANKLEYSEAFDEFVESMCD